MDRNGIETTSIILNLSHVCTYLSLARRTFEGVVEFVDCDAAEDRALGDVAPTGPPEEPAIGEVPELGFMLWLLLDLALRSLERLRSHSGPNFMGLFRSPIIHV